MRSDGVLCRRRLSSFGATPAGPRYNIVFFFASMSKGLPVTLTTIVRRIENLDPIARRFENVLCDHGSIYRRTPDHLIGRSFIGCAGRDMRR